MFCCPCFIAVLHSPGHADVLRPFETAYEAIAQAHAWLRGQAVAEVPTPGYVCWLTTADTHTYARVESHALVLAEPCDDDDLLARDLDPDADDAPAHLVTRPEWHALLRARGEVPGEEVCDA